MPAMRAAFHHVRTHRSGALLRHQKGRAARGLRPAEALHRPQEGDRKARYLARAAARDRRRHRGGAAALRPCGDPKRGDRRDGDGPPARLGRSRIHPLRLCLSRVHGPPAGQAGDRTSPELAPTWLPRFRRVVGVSTTPAALHVLELADEPGLVHGFSTVALGSVGLKHAADPDAALAARRAFAGVLGLDSAELTTMGSVHGASVARVDKPRGSVDDVAAPLTHRPGVALFYPYADCSPIPLSVPVLKVAGLVQAGWPSPSTRLAPTSVRNMQDEVCSRR